MNEKGKRDERDSQDSQDGAVKYKQREKKTESGGGRKREKRYINLVEEKQTHMNRQNTRWARWCKL